MRVIHRVGNTPENTVFYFIFFHCVSFLWNVNSSDLLKVFIILVNKRNTNECEGAMKTLVPNH